MNRREFTKLIAAMPLGYAFSNALAADGPIYERQDIRTFSQDPRRVQQLRDAVQKLKGRPYTNATSWYNYAAIHEIASTDPNISKVPPDIQALWHQCHSDESLFFIWHRAYVAALEKLFQAAVNDTTFRLPYWDWYTDPKLPEIFRSQYYVRNGSQKTNPLYVSARNTGINAGADVWTPTVTTDYANASFFDFQGILNTGEHGTIHVAVGNKKNMANKATAARDPIFFLHHAQMDRLLMSWLSVDPLTHQVPSEYPAWQPSVYRFPLSTGGVATPSIEELALGSMETMGYRYENTTPPALQAPLPAAPGALTGTSTSTTTARMLSDDTSALTSSNDLSVGSDVTVNLTMSEASASATRTLRLSGDASSDTVELVLEKVSVRDLPEGLLSYQLYLNLPHSPGRNERTQDYFIGNISLFMLGHMGADHPGMKHHTTLRYDISQLAAKALRKSRTLQVSFIPVLSPGASSPASPALKIGEVRIESRRSSGSKTR